MIWEQVNEDRKKLKVAHYKNAFPEAVNDINFTTLVEVNQYKSTVTNVDEFVKGSTHISDIGSDKCIQK